MSDNTETILRFTHDDGRLIDIDHLGILDHHSRGEFAIYDGDKQIGDFMLSWAMEFPDIKARRELPDDDELITQAKLALAGDPPILTQRAVPQVPTAAAGRVDRRCKGCGCTDSAACNTITGPCAWRVTYEDNTGLCTACSPPGHARHQK